MSPEDSNSAHDKAVSQHEASFVELIKAGEAMQVSIAALKAENEKLKAQILHIGLAGDMGKTITSDLVKAYVGKALVKSLHDGDAQEIIAICETFPEDADNLIPVFEHERHDTAIYAESIHAFNGRSLDSHNPWHLSKSYRVHLSEIDEPGRLTKVTPARTSAVAPSFSVWFDVCADASALHSTWLPSTITTPESVGSIGKTALDTNHDQPAHSIIMSRGSSPAPHHALLVA